MQQLAGGGPGEEAAEQLRIREAELVGNLFKYAVQAEAYQARRHRRRPTPYTLEPAARRRSCTGCGCPSSDSGALKP